MTPLLRYTGKGRAAEVTRAWEGRTVALVCPGPSLTREQLELLRDAQVPTIAVNDAYLVAAWAQVMYFADAGWWKLHSAGIVKRFGWASFSAAQVCRLFVDFPGQKATLQHAEVAPDPTLYVLGRDGTTPEGLSADPRAIRTGDHSGYQALNIAVLSGAKRILLVGYDMRFVGGRSHAHNGHPHPSHEANYGYFAKQYRTVETPLEQLGIEVVNCTPGSALTRFRFSTLEQELAQATA